MQTEFFLGLDIGTSGARACVIDAAGNVHAEGRAAMDGDLREPEIWWQAASSALKEALQQVDRHLIRTLAVDGTSGTVLPVDEFGRPMALARMYNDASDDAALLARLKKTAPAVSGAHGSTSGFLKAMAFQSMKPAKILHQADWMQFQFSGRFASDHNNALKTGFDPGTEGWPDWLSALGFDVALLPEVLAPGDVIGKVKAQAATAFDLPRDMLIVAGTTDGCASFLATGANAPGDGVTALGTTLTLKLFSDKPVFAPDYGIYSHKLLGKWLAGGASNSGGNVLLAHFKPDEIEALSKKIDTDNPTGLDYYPLAKPGERFPIADPALPPRLEPRPDAPEDFLQALFEGIAAIEKLGYQRLSALGAPLLKSVRSVGGGAKNSVWSKIRAGALGVPMPAPLSDEAAYGAALLARAGFEQSQV